MQEVTKFVFLPQVLRGKHQPEVIGPVTKGHWVQVGMGIGFYVPEEAYQCVQAIADDTRRVQFLAVTKDGRAIHASRDELVSNPEVSGGIAWIVPHHDKEVR